MTTLDEGEHQRLQDAINKAEKFLTSNSAASSPLAPTIESDRKRVHTLEESGVLDSESHERKKSNSTHAVAVAALVAQETALSHEERQTYASFLHQDYFTKKNFNELDAFYADGGAWHRLSDEGKKQMSQRFWNGVERGEYEFQEAPQNVQKNEADQLAYYIANPDKAPDIIKRMNPEASEKFLTAHEAGDRAKMQEILSGKALFDSSHEKSQPASVRSVEAATRDENVEADKVETAQKRGIGKTDSDDHFFASLETTAQIKPTEIQVAGTPKTIG